MTAELRPEAEAGDLPDQVGPAVHEFLVKGRELRTLANKLDLVRERLHKDRIHHGIFGDQASGNRVRQYEAEERKLVHEAVNKLHEVRAAVGRVKP